MLINLNYTELPRGFSFNPNDEDAIFFLNEKVAGRGGGGGGCMIHDLDPYDLKQLPEIFAATEKLDSLYFFTKLRRKTKSAKKSDHSCNIDRTVRGKTKVVGSWHGDTNKEIKDGRKKVIGVSRKLSYRPAPGTAGAAAGSRNRNRYIMTEYLLPSNGAHYDIFKDGVLCRLVKNSKRKDGEESAANFLFEEEVEATTSEIATNQTLAACDGDDQELNDSIQQAFHEILEDGDDDEQELLDNPAANPGSDPVAAENARTCEVDQASVINNLPISTAADIQRLQTLGGFEHCDNQAMAYDSYMCCEAPAMNNVFPLQYSTTTAVQVAPLQSVTSFEDLMGMNYEDPTPLLDWQMEDPSEVGEEWEACIKAFSD